MPNTTPIADLVRARMAALGLGQEAVGLRLGYRNTAKAAGRVYAFLDGNVPLSPKSLQAVARLHSALDLPPEVVEDAVRRTNALFAERTRSAEEARQQDEERKEATWRAAFQPHAVLHTEHVIPSSITMCSLTGGAGDWIFRSLDLSRPPVTFADQVVAALPQPKKNGRRYVIFFGEVLGFFVNYSPDEAVRFDLEGNPVEVLPAAYRPGEVALRIGRRPVVPAVAARVLNTM